MNNVKKREVPHMFTRAYFSPTTLDAVDRTVDVVVATETPVLRYDYAGGFAFNEVLDFSESSVRMERLNAGAPLVDSHNTYSVRDVLGTVEKAWLEDGKMHATLRLSKRPEVAGIIEDIADGILKNISVGYSIYGMREDAAEEGEIPTFRAIDWEPTEISLVSVPADISAGVRSKESEGAHNECTFESGVESAENLKKDEKMDEKDKKVTPETRASEEKKAAPVVDESKVAESAVKAERQRASEIHSVCRQAGLDAKQEREFLDSGMAVEEVRKHAIDAMAKKNEEAKIVNVGSDKTDDKKARMMEDMEKWINVRTMASNSEEDRKNMFAGDSFYDVARKFVEAEGNMPEMVSKMEVASRALHHTSDFPKVLANVMNKRLRKRFEQSPATYEPLVTRVSASDFRPISSVQLGEAPKLLPTNENGEFKYGTVGENGETYVLATYGRILGVSRQMIINDDLKVFDRIGAAFADQARNLVSDLVWSQITANANMADGNAVFSAPHANLGSGALDPTDLTSMAGLRSKLRLQKGIDGETPLNILPRHLIVPVALETKAEQIISGISPNQASQVNPFTGLNLIVEPRLDATSSAEFYMAGDQSQIDMIELAFLDGQDAPYVESRMGFNVDGIEIKVRLDVAAKIVEYRGIAKSTGS